MLVARCSEVSTYVHSENVRKTALHTTQHTLQQAQLHVFSVLTFSSPVEPSRSTQARARARGTACATASWGCVQPT